MVAAFDDEQICGGLEPADDRLQLSGGAEGVTRTLHKQNRGSHAWQMGCAQPVGSAGWMQGIAEKHEPSQVAGTARSAIGKM